MAITECFADRARSQRRGRSGFAPGSLFVGGQKFGPPTTNARFDAANIARFFGDVKTCTKNVERTLERQ
jgi:hypothetical protein